MQTHYTNQMKTINEGNLAFTFPAAWEVIKYDDTDFYRQKLERTGAGLSAVDIVVRTNNTPSHLLMIEVKDFRGHGVDNRKRQTSGELVTEVIQKALHTLSGIYTASRITDIELEPICQLLISPPEKLELVLFMEEDVVPAAQRFKLENQRKQMQNMEVQLNSKLKKALRIESRVLNTSLLKSRDSWSAV